MNNIENLFLAIMQWFVPNNFIMTSLQKLNRMVFVFLIFVFVASCQKEVEVKIPDSKYKIVLNSIMSEDSLFTVSVTRTKKLYADDNKILSISNATVSIYENGNFIENLKHIENDVYKSTFFKPKNGNTYKVVVKANGFDEASAEEVLIKQANISNITFKDSALVKENETYAKVSFDIDDPSVVKNYYELEIIIINYFPDYSQQPPVDSVRVVFPTYMLITDEALKDNFVPDIDGGGQDYGTSNLQFTDKYFDGKKYTVNAFVNSYSYTETDSMLVKVKSVSKSYYEYKRTALEQQNADGPFSEPVRVYTNVVGGVGVLGSYSQVKKYIVR